MLNEVLKICEKLYLLTEILIKTTRNKTSGGYILQIFFIEIQCIRNIYFSFNFGWYSIHFDIVR